MVSGRRLSARITAPIAFSEIIGHMKSKRAWPGAPYNWTRSPLSSSTWPRSNATVVVRLPTASASALATSVLIGGTSDSASIAVVLPAPIGPANTMRYGPMGLCGPGGSEPELAAKLADQPGKARRPGVLDCRRTGACFAGGGRRFFGEGSERERRVEEIDRRFVARLGHDTQLTDGQRLRHQGGGHAHVGVIVRQPAEVGPAFQFPAAHRVEFRSQARRAVADPERQLE